MVRSFIRGARLLLPWDTRTMVLVGGICVLQLAVIKLAYDLGFHTQASPRLIYHAIPVAISTLYHGWPLDMTALHGVAMAFQSPTNDLDGLIRSQIAAALADDAVYYWNADDRGMGLYVILAFYIFGASIKSVHILYFLIMSVSVFSYVHAYRKNISKLIYMMFLLAGWYVAFRAAPFSFDPAGFGEMNTAPTDSRGFELLAMPALLHLLLWGDERGKASALEWGALFFQAMLLAFLLLCRSALMVPLYVTFGLLLVSLIVQKEGKVRRGIVIVFLASAVLAGGCVERFVYNPSYRAVDRTVWHNVLMGIVSPAIRSATGLAGQSDLAGVDAVQRYARDQGRLYEWQHWPAQKILNTLGGHGAFNWREYDREARSLWFSLWRDWPWEMLKDYSIRKPLEILRVVVRTRRPADGPPEGGGMRAWQAGAGLTLFCGPIFFAGLVAVFANRGQVWRMPPLHIFAGLFCGALVPSLLFYAIYPILMSAVALGCVGGLCVLSAAGAWGMRKMVSRLNPLRGGG